MADPVPVAVPGITDPEQVRVLLYASGKPVHAPLVGTIAGAGVMFKDTYDPQGKSADAFDRANHTGTQAISTVAGLRTSLRRNLWVNGSFQVSQEKGNTLGTTTGYYPADQTALYFAASSAAMSVQRIQARTLASATDQIEVKTITVKASLGTGDFVTLTQNIEGSAFASAGFGTASAVPLVLRAEVRLPAGLYHFHFCNSARNRHCAVPFTIAGAEANVPAVREIVVPPDTTGTWLTADGVIGITCDLVLAAGAFLTGSAASTWGSAGYMAASTQKNILDSTANVARLADVGLKLDPDAAGVYGAYTVPDKDIEEMRCLAFFEVLRSTALNQVLLSGSFSGGQNSASYDFKRIKSKPPSAILAPGASWINNTPILYSSRDTIVAFSNTGNFLISATNGSPALVINARLS